MCVAVCVGVFGVCWCVPQEGEQVRADVPPLAECAAPHTACHSPACQRADCQTHRGTKRGPEAPLIPGCVSLREFGIFFMKPYTQVHIYQQQGRLWFLFLLFWLSVVCFFKLLSVSVDVQVYIFITSSLKTHCKDRKEEFLCTGCVRHVLCSVALTGWKLSCFHAFMHSCLRFMIKAQSGCFCAVNRKHSQAAGPH